MVYLDNAASSFPKPPSVSKAMARAVDLYGANPGRSSHSMSMFAAEKVYKCRECLSEFFKAPAPENVVFTSNATHALNIAIKGTLKSGGHAIISDLEHNSVLRPVKNLESAGATLSIAKVDLEDDEKTFKAFKKQINKNTKMIICSHASNVLGKILPVKEIGALAREYGLLFAVDCAQTGGSQHIDMSEQCIDILCLSGHKGLYGPQGTGAMILGQNIDIEPLTYGGTGTNSIDYEQPLFPPERFESGTLNTPGIAGLNEGVNFLKETGIENIREHEKNLLLYLYDELLKIPDVTLYTPRPESGYCAVLSFNVDGKNSNEVSAHLDSLDIMTRSGLHCSPLAHTKINTLKQGAVRASIGAFNTFLDVEQLLSAIHKI